jgi:hypothetical protein
MPVSPNPKSLTLLLFTAAGLENFPDEIWRQGRILKRNRL